MSVDINISNYESYLYCYVDGELTADETAALERFVAINPQARAELDQLMATRLQPEKIVFENKASLYRESEIHLQNYEGYLLSYIDGELNPEEEKSLEQFMARHPKVRQELVMWQGTKQHVDPSIRFENKSVLYRHTKTHTIRMRPAYWWAAAAMLAGVLAFIRLSDRNQAGPEPVTLADVEKVQPAKAPEQHKPAEELADNRITMKEEITPEPEKPTAAKPIVPKQNIAAAVIPRKQAPQPEPVIVQKETTASIDLARIQTEKTTAALIDQQHLEAALATPPKALEGSEIVVAANTKPSAANTKPSIDQQTTPPATLATPAPAAAAPGEFIMSVTGNGLESKVLDKVSNVARFFSKKKKR